MVPDGVIDNFARAVGIEVDGSDAMDVDGLQRRGFQLVQSKVKEVMREGYSATQILTQVNTGPFHQFLPMGRPCLRFLRPLTITPAT